jgi:hypothetical protein
MQVSSKSNFFKASPSFEERKKEKKWNRPWNPEYRMHFSFPSVSIVSLCTLGCALESRLTSSINVANESQKLEKTEGRATIGENLASPEAESVERGRGSPVGSHSRVALDLYKEKRRYKQK